jgi:hypothetical protein
MHMYRELRRKWSEGQSEVVDLNIPYSGDGYQNAFKYAQFRLPFKMLMLKCKN